jgi:hypothetical protein
VAQSEGKSFMNVFDRLDVFRKEVEASKKKVKIQRTINEESREKVMQEEDSF